MALEKTKTSGVFKRIGLTDITYCIRYKKFGKTKDESVGKKSDGMTESKAKKILQEKLILISKGLDDSIVNKDNKIVSTNNKMSLNKLAEIYFIKIEKEAKDEEHLEKQDKKNKDINGVKREKSLYNNFWTEWGLSTVPFYKLNENHFVEYVKELQRLQKTIIRNLEEIKLPKYSSKYILNALTLIKSIIKHTKCSHNPLDLNKNNENEKEELKKLYKFLKDKSTPRTEYLELTQIKLLLDTLKGNDKHLQGYLMCLLLATTGMRPNSCLNLRIKDLMFKDKIIKTYDFKRKNTYYCNLTPFLISEIQVLIRDRNPSDFLFFNEKTKGITKIERTPDYLSEVISELFNRNRYGKDRIVVYNLRHSFATNLIKGIKNEKGEFTTFPVAIFTIQKLLNHSNVETTIKNYAKFSPDFAIEAVRDLEERFI